MFVLIFKKKKIYPLPNIKCFFFFFFRVAAKWPSLQPPLKILQ